MKAIKTVKAIFGGLVKAINTILPPDKNPIAVSSSNHSRHNNYAKGINATQLQFSYLINLRHIYQCKNLAIVLYAICINQVGISMAKKF